MTIRSIEGKQPDIAVSAYVDDAAVVIGAYTNIQDGSIVHVTHDGEFSPGGHPCRIGSFVTVGHGAIVHACEVGDYCLVGMAATIMDGAVLEPKVMLAAGGLVPSGKRLEGGYLWVGSPAKRARPLKDKELEFLGYSARHYTKLKERHRR